MKSHNINHVIIFLALFLFFPKQKQHQQPQEQSEWSRPLLQAQACAPRFGNSPMDTNTYPYSIWQLLFRQRDNGNDNKASDNDDDDENDNDADVIGDKEITWTTVDWLTKHNYTYEDHNVTTMDGYELHMQRLPREGARPVLLVHGLLTSSLAWVLMGPGKSLAFQLHTRHYDVWLANLRGSTPYDELFTNTSVEATSAQFWNYSFHEHGAYDLPALIDHIREQSSFHQVLLIAHSQAFNAFLVLCSLHPIYNERILFTQALAPIVRLRNYVKFGTADVRRIMKFVKTKQQSKHYELFPVGNLKRKCLNGKRNEHILCRKYLKLITGSGEYTKSQERLIYGQLLHGGSLKEITHLHQIWQSGDFVAYDYGPINNLKYYNSVESLNYNLSQVRVPTVLYFGATDAFATPDGVHSIYAKMPLKKIMGVYRITATKFNHLDFLCSTNLNTLVNDRLIENMEKFMEGKLRYVIE